MATYSTLEEIKTGMQDDLFADDLISNYSAPLWA